MKKAGTTTYAINGLGQRVKKNNGTDIFFAYDEAGHLIGEYDATGAPIQETVWLGDLPVAVIKPNGATFDVFYIWTDNLGTPREITDAANQERWEWPNADPFGNNQPNENPAGLGVFSYNLRFPGQYYDAEKGSNYNYFLVLVSSCSWLPDPAVPPGVMTWLEAQYLFLKQVEQYEIRDTDHNKCNRCPAEVGAACRLDPKSNCACD